MAKGGKIKNWDRKKSIETGKTIRAWEHSDSGKTVEVKKKKDRRHGKKQKTKVYIVVVPGRHNPASMNNKAVSKYASNSGSTFKQIPDGRGGTRRTPTREGAISAATGWMRKHPNP